MKNISEQKIIVFCDFSESMNGIILHGIKLASMLEKELCLLAFVPKNGNKLEIQEKLGDIAVNLKEKAKSMVVSTLTLKLCLEDQIDRLADKYDAIVVITNKKDLNNKLSALQESVIPFLFVDGKNSDLISYKNVLLPVDFRKEMKETSLWASYFGRFNEAIIQVIYATDRNKNFMAGVKRNLLFIKKFLTQFELIFLFIKGKSGSWGIQKESLLRANSKKGDVLIILGSKHITPIDLLIGLPEKKLVKKAGNLPVLCINPSKDMNILCD